MPLAADALARAARVLALLLYPHRLAAVRLLPGDRAGVQVITDSVSVQPVTLVPSLRVCLLLVLTRGR